jgi:hypothetical protein
VSEDSEFSENIWIRDSGASFKYCSNDLGLSDFRDVYERIKVGNVKNMEATKIGSLSLRKLKERPSKFCFKKSTCVRSLDESFSIIKAPKNLL